MGATKTKTVVYIAGASKQMLHDDIETTLRYINKELGSEWVVPDTAEQAKTALEKIDTGDRIELNESSPSEGEPAEKIIMCHDKTWHPDDERKGASRLMNGVAKNNGKIENVVIARSDRLVTDDQTLDHVRALVDEYGANLHLVEQGVTIRANADLSGSLLRVLSSHTQMEEAGKNDGVNPVEKHTGGRPPIGFTSVDGKLEPTEDYENVCSDLQAVEDGELSIHRAANRLDCARQTVRNAREKTDLYQIN